MRKEFLDQVDRSAGSGIPGDDGQITPDTLTQWELLTSLREQTNLGGNDYSYEIATYIRPLEQQYMLLVQQYPQRVRELVHEQRQAIIAHTGSIPSRPQLIARFLDEQVGSYLQSRAASYSTQQQYNWSRLALWYDTAYGFRTMLAAIHRADAALRGEGDREQNAAQLLQKDPSGFHLIDASVAQLKADAFDAKVRRVRQNIYDYQSAGYDINSYYFTTDLAFAEAVRSKQLPGTSRIMPYQVEETVVAGAEFAQHAYQAIYPLSE